MKLEYVIQSITEQLDKNKSRTPPTPEEMSAINYIIKSIEEYMDEKSYSHKPHLAELPYDLNTNDPDKLKERLKACRRGLKEAKEDLKDWTELYEFNVESIKKEESDIKAIKEEIQTLKDQNEQIQSQADKLYEHFDDISKQTIKEAEEISVWEREVLNDELVDYSGADIKKIRGLMEHFREDIAPKGYLDQSEVKEIKEMADTIEEELSFIDTNYSSHGDDYLEGVNAWTDDLRDYAEEYDINGNTDNTKELAKREEGMSDKWYEIIQRNEKEIKNKEPYIDGHQANIDNMMERQPEIKREIGKAETRVKDFTEQEQLIKDKLEE